MNKYPPQNMLYNLLQYGAVPLTNLLLLIVGLDYTPRPVGKPQSLILFGRR